MTGFGRGQAALGAGGGGGKVVIELRSVNHRYQDIRTHLAPELASVDEVVDRRLRSSCSRGRIELTARLEGTTPLGIHLDTALARSCLEELEALRCDMGLEETVSINMLAAVPQVFRQEMTCGPEDVRVSVLEALEQAIAAADTMKVREGEALRHDFENRLAHVSELIAELLKRSEMAAPEALERLRLRLERLVEEGRFDDSRLAQEAALLADRYDVTEELTRLQSHVDQFRRIGREDGPIGRRLEFLLQEMAREASTTSAKVQDAEVQHIIVDLRGEIARLREQIQNIE